MSVDPTAGPGYQYPTDGIPQRPMPQDSGFESGPRNPDGSDIGPLYLSPDAERWIQQNVTDFGYIIDWGTREIVDTDTGEVKGIIPTSVPRMT